MTQNRCRTPSVLSADVLHVTDGFCSCFKAQLHWSIFFIKPELKVDGKYYCEVLLKKQMLPVIHGIAGNTFAFNKTVHLCSVHHTREIVQLLEQETLDFISPDLWPQTIRT